ncbi:MAG: methyltransferase domain-containing protein [Verrucomicrobiota bacterium]|nr:methyltransferase domain-containing protein [Verrucomicrobiota bacterium]
MRRQFDPALLEMMDRPQPITPELERDLANIRSLNRWFGSYRLVKFFLRRWLRPNLRVLDLATGSGDIPRLVADCARRRGFSVRIDAIDQQQATIEIARRLSASYPEITFTRGDLFAWETTEPYDIVLFNLALHHFAEEDAVRVLRKCRELAGSAALVSDLRRARWLSCAVWLLTVFVYREPMTQIDARLSAARAFSFREMRALAERAGWRGFGHRRFAIGRQAIWNPR